MKEIDIIEIKTRKQAKPEYKINPLIASRWSPRSFLDKKVEEEKLHQVFEAARWAASANNGQPWRFMYAHRGTKEYDLMFNHLSEYNQGWVGNAPVLVFTAHKKTYANGSDNFHALYDLGLAIGNLSIQAQELGLAVHNMAGVNWRKAHETYNVPPEFHITTAIAIGYYGGDPSVLSEDFAKSEVAERKRRKQNKFVGKGKWVF